MIWHSKKKNNPHTFICDFAQHIVILFISYTRFPPANFHCGHSVWIGAFDIMWLCILLNSLPLFCLTFILCNCQCND